MREEKREYVRMTPMKYLLVGLAFIFLTNGMTLPIVAKVIIENSLRENVQAREVVADVYSEKTGRRSWALEMLAGEMHRYI